MGKIVPEQQHALGDCFYDYPNIMSIFSWKEASKAIPLKFISAITSFQILR